MKCALCLRVLTAETSVYSAYRRVHYCAPPWRDCDKVRAQIEAVNVKATKAAA